MPSGTTAESGAPRGVSRRGLVLLHASYWGTYLALLLTIVTILQARVRAAGAGWPATLTVLLVVTLTAPNVAAFYASYGRLFPLVRRRRPWPFIVGAGSATCAVAALSAFAILYLGAGAPPLPLHEAASFALLLLGLFALAGLHSGLALGLRGFIEWFDQLREREDRERRAHALELALLRSRLDPHFLFNTVNNIDVLIEKDAALASEYLHRLSALIRYVLFEAEAARVPLVTELDHMKRYLEIESLRHAHPRYATFDVTGDPAGLTIPPTLFMPFVENAFKHAAPGDGPERVRVRCEIHGARVTFHCVNPARPDGATHEHGGGLGQTLAQRRLELLYPGHHSLQLQRDGGDYVVTLTVHAHDDPVPDR